jgi:CHAT domain-containing protein
VAIDEHMIGQAFSLGAEQQRILLLETVQEDFHKFLSLVTQHLPTSASAVCAGLDLVLRRKAITSEILATQRDVATMLGGRYPALQPKLRELAMLRMQIAERTLAGPGPEGMQEHRKLLTEWHNQSERLEVQLARMIPRIKLEQRLRQADRQALAQALPENSALVEFACFPVYAFKAVPARGEAQWRPAHYAAFVLLAGEPDNVQLFDLGEAEPIDQLIADFRAAVLGEAVSQAGRNLVMRPAESVQLASVRLGLSLREAVFDQLVPALSSRKQLFLVPDGDLTRLPWEVLPTQDGLRLIDQYQMSYLGTGRDLLRFKTRPTGRPAPPLVVADPDFNLEAEATNVSRTPAKTPHVLVREGGSEPPGRCSRDLDVSRYHFDRLPGTRAEGERVAGLLGVQSWLGAAALEGQLKKDCHSPCILHLATHGFFLEDQLHYPNHERLDMWAAGWETDDPIGRLSGPLPENPLLRSGLALAGANTWMHRGRLPAEAEDGLLTAEDVSGLDLLDTELVVLSACETGLGKVHVGEGVFGLRRAFVLAGAKTLIMTLWKVPDQQTQELMEDFYRRILSGEPRAEALRQAQLALKTKYFEPYYWGGFICQGDPTPLK